MVEKDGAKAYLVENAEYASKDRREIPIETDDIGAVYKENILQTTRVASWQLEQGEFKTVEHERVHGARQDHLVYGLPRVVSPATGSTH